MTLSPIFFVSLWSPFSLHTCYVVVQHSGVPFNPGLSLLVARFTRSTQTCSIYFCIEMCCYTSPCIQYCALLSLYTVCTAHVTRTYLSHSTSINEQPHSEFLLLACGRSGFANRRKGDLQNEILMWAMMKKQNNKSHIWRLQNTANYKPHSTTFTTSWVFQELTCHQFLCLEPCFSIF